DPDMSDLLQNFVVDVTTDVIGALDDQMSVESAHWQICSRFTSSETNIQPIRKEYCRSRPVARYVRVKIIGSAKLTLCEVEVFGESANIAKLKPAEQSSEAKVQSTIANAVSIGETGAGLAVDGNTDQLDIAECATSSTTVQSNLTWAVDLRGDFLIEEVFIYG
ncbi:unnamed protein product, partial [Owenia fusiformis]